VPYTFFWLLAEKRTHPIRSALLLSFGTSLFFELSQLIFSLGSFQFSDLMWNVIGGAMGLGIWKLEDSLRSTILKRLHNKKTRPR